MKNKNEMKKNNRFLEGWCALGQILILERCLPQASASQNMSANILDAANGEPKNIDKTTMNILTIIRNKTTYCVKIYENKTKIVDFGGDIGWWRRNIDKNVDKKYCKA